MKYVPDLIFYHFPCTDGLASAAVAKNFYSNEKIEYIQQDYGNPKAVGNCFAFKYYGPTISFKAPWGEDMICKEGDFICSTSKESLDDVYRIEKDAFMATYKPD